MSRFDSFQFNMVSEELIAVQYWNMTEKFEKCLDFSVILGLLETQVSEPKSWPYLKWVKMMTPQEWPGSPYVAIPTVCGHMLTRCLGWVCPFHWPGCSVVLESPEFPLAESRGFGLGGSGADSEAVRSLSADMADGRHGLEMSWSWWTSPCY